MSGTLEAEPGIYSFYGADGCGKSTIAQCFVNELIAQEKSCLVIGGSSYKDWLTPQVARETLGVGHHIGDTITTPAEYTILCEEIGVACYGLATKLRNDGVNVAIDSDPWLKRIIWSRVTTPEEDERKRYVEHFEDLMCSHLGAAIGPDAVIGVNMDNRMNATDILKRLHEREGNSEHDPKNIEDMRRLMRAVGEVWAGVNAAIEFGTSSIPGFNARLQGARRLLVQNPQCKPELVRERALSIAHDLVSELKSSS